jgi:hypothetical protein
MNKYLCFYSTICRLHNCTVFFYEINTIDFCGSTMYVLYTVFCLQISAHELCYAMHEPMFFYAFAYMRFFVIHIDVYYIITHA